MVGDVQKLEPTGLWRSEGGGRLKIAPLKLSKSTLGLAGLWLTICADLLIGGWRAAAAGFADSDDATRLMLVRDLVTGRGWYDQKVLRIQPPDGVWLHWSRLLDGALAAPLWGLERLLRPAQAEFWLRLLWPLVLLLPMLLAARSLVRRFNPEPAQRFAAETAAAAMALACLPLYAQFHPGRIDHHNVQILLWLVAFAGAVGEGRRSAALAGGAMGLGLAIGLEAIVFEAAIAAFMAVRMLVRPDEAPRTRAFALAMGGVLCAAFLVQTPPTRWGVSACDALGVNLSLGAATGCALLVGASFASGVILRIVLTFTAGAAAAAACLALDPACAHGPFAAVDQRIFGIWLNGVQEMRSIPQLLQGDFATGLTLLIAIISALAAWLALGVLPGERTRPVYVLTGLMLVIAAASTWGMLRMSSYLMWAAIPAGATLAARLATRFSRTTPAPTVRLLLFGLALAPNAPAAPIVAAMRLAPHRSAVGAPVAAADDGCFRLEAYRELATLPSGLIVAETDLGAFVLVYTRNAVLAAPYHRADKGIIAAHAILSAPPERARWLARASGATYLLTCPAHGSRDDKAFESQSLRTLLDAGQTPDWLTRLSSASSAVQIFRVTVGDPAQLRSMMRTSLPPASVKNEAPRRLVDMPALKGPKSVAATPVQSISRAT
jgi:hypothetical protein